jgi:hypothetical protein
MKQHGLIQRINELLSILVTEVKGATALGLFDLHTISEDVLLPILKLAYNSPNLVNVNLIESTTFPSVDLVDYSTRIAFQITSQNDLQKINETLVKFSRYELFKDFDKLYIYIITEKQKKYSFKNFDTSIHNKFKFDPDHQILDYKDLLKKVRSLQFDEIEQISRILEIQYYQTSNYKDLKTEPFRANFSNNNLKEKIYSNLLEIGFPKAIYVADLIIDRKEILKNSVFFGKKLKRNSTPRQIVFAALNEIGLKFGSDWVVHENKIITFHNLLNNEIPLSQIIDKGTITELESKEFYQVDKDYENVFKSLLKFCLQQKLYHRSVSWNYTEKLFVFLPFDDSLITRKEQWHSKKQTTRTVFEAKKYTKDGNEKISYCKHLAFQVQFKNVSEKWYILINPEWFISFDGFNKSYYGAERIDYLKKQEKNEHVFNHLKFITHFLKSNTKKDLFSKEENYSFLNFKSLVSFNSSPVLPDETWYTSESAENKYKITDNLGVIEIPM